MSNLMSEHELNAIIQSYSLPADRHPAWTDFVAEVFKAILVTAQASEVTGGHANAAVTALSCMLQNRPNEIFSCAESRLGLWLQCFEVYLLRLDDSIKSKVTRNLLSVLVVLFKTQTHDQETKDGILYALIHVISSQTNRIRAKGTLSVICLLLSKHQITAKQLAVLHVEQHSVNETIKDTDYQALYFSILKWIRESELGSITGQTVSTLFRVSLDQENVGSDAKARTFQDWLQPLSRVLESSPDSIARLRLYALSGLLQNLTSDEYVQLLDAVKHTTSNSPRYNAEDTYLEFVLVGKETGLVIEPENDKSCDSSSLVSQSGETLVLNPQMLSHLLVHPSATQRLTALSLIVRGPSKTKPLGRMLHTLKKSLPFHYGESETGIRGEILTMIKKLLQRLQLVCFRLDNLTKSKENSQDTSTSSTREDLASHIDFARWLVSYSISQLRPEAGYQRHIFSLKVLSLIYRSTKLTKDSNEKLIDRNSRWHQDVLVERPELKHLLADLCTNPFEDVRQNSALLLCQVMGQKDFQWLSSVVDSSENRMVQTGRLDHADGYAKLYAILGRLANRTEEATITVNQSSYFELLETLLDKIEISIRVAQRNMNEAIAKYPLHGLLLATRSLLEESTAFPSRSSLSSNGDDQLWRVIYDRLANAIENVWLLVRNILCSDAPEGYVPEEIEDEDSLTSKDITSYSWRAMKEACGIITVIVSKASYTKGRIESINLCNSDIDRFCQIVFDGLTKLRHRGALSAAAQVFQACCQRYTRENKTMELEGLYQRALLCVDDCGSTTTRRSAGIPSLFIGILSSSSKSDSLSKVMFDLQDIVNRKASTSHPNGDLPQVHALNCLKAIFTNSILGPASEPYLAQGLSISGQCLTSEIWAVRNCGLMLFRALIDRLLGSTESQNWQDFKPSSQSRISWTAYPELQNIVLNLLLRPAVSLGSFSAGVESVFLALKMIQRIPPPPEYQDQVREQVLGLAWSTHWHVRDMAARTFASLLDFTKTRLVGMLTGLLSIDEPLAHQNRLHGTLLCVLYVLKYSKVTHEDHLREKLAEVFKIFLPSQDRSICLTDAFLIQNPCPSTQAAYLNILAYLNIQSLRLQPDDHPPQYVPLPELLEIVNSSSSTTMLRRSAFQLAIVTYDGKGWLAQCLQTISGQDPNTFAWILTDSLAIVNYLSRSNLEVLATSVQLLCFHRVLAQSSRQLLSTILKDASFNPQGAQFFDGLQMLKAKHNESPSQLQAGIELWSLMMKRNSSDSNAKDYLKEVLLLLRTIRPLIDEQQHFSMRYSAVSALSNLEISHVKCDSLSAALHSTQLEYSLLIYDALIDDDEEIREIAANKAQNILQSFAITTTRTLPAATQNKLASSLPKIFGNRLILQTEAVRRMTGSTNFVSEQGLIPQASERFGRINTETTDLFMVEKQNLYRDEVRESDIWLNVLRKLTVNDKLMKHLYDWTLQGLILIRQALTRKASECSGWISKPEVFTFVWQVVNAVSLFVPYFIRERQRELIKTIQDLADICEHPLLLRKIQKIMVSYVTYRLRAATTIINDISIGDKRPRE